MSLSPFAGISPFRVTAEVATPTFTRYAGNPTFPLTTGGGDYDSQVFDFNVITDPLNSAKWLCFATCMAAPVWTGISVIGTFSATKADPYTWTYNGSVLESSGLEEESLRMGSIVVSGGTLYLYYNDSPSDGSGDPQTRLATSTDGITFTREPTNPIMTATGQGRDDGRAVILNAVIKEGSDWWMIYVPYSDPPDILPGYRYAHSTDGIVWAKGGSESYITAPDQGEYHNLQKIGSTYWLFYERGYTGGSFTQYRIAAAHSPNVTGPYISSPDNPILSESGTVGAFDRYHVATPNFLQIGPDQWLLFYCGARDQADPYYTNHWAGGQVLLSNASPDTYFAKGAAPDISGLATGLVSHWRLDEASGSRLDLVGDNDLTNNNSVGTAGGIIPSGAAFYAASSFATASSRFLSIASNSSLQAVGSFSISAWVYLASQVNPMSIVTKDSDAADSRDYTLDYGDEGSGYRFRFYINGNATGLTIVRNTAAVSNNRWVHVVAVRDATAGTMNIYVDGVVSTPVSTAVVPTTSSAQFMIGARQYATSECYFDGRIANVYLWSRAITDAEVTLLYHRWL